MFHNTQFAYKFALNLHFRLKIPYYSVVKDRICARLLLYEDAGTAAKLSREVALTKRLTG
jgi:hypothetical protein